MIDAAQLVDLSVGFEHAGVEAADAVLLGQRRRPIEVQQPEGELRRGIGEQLQQVFHLPPLPGLLRVVEGGDPYGNL
jgi:hypothetical protein